MKKIKGVKILKHVNLKKYNTYRIECYADYLAIPENVESLINLLKYLKDKNIRYKIIGGGSNLIFHGNFKGFLISLARLDKISINKNKITVESGASLIKTSLKAAKLGLAGMEFASGIPGTIGGAVYNNAGAYKSDMGYIVESIKVLTKDLKIKRIYNKDLDFHYRKSLLKVTNDYICLEANIILKYGDKDKIQNVIKDRKQRRIETQPLSYPSAGSVFRNPENNYAGKLIEDIGYKGKIIGGAKISEKHANFIINIGGATGDDIIKLINQTKEKIKQEYGINLILEQEIVEGSYEERKEENNKKTKKICSKESSKKQKTKA